MPASYTWLQPSNARKNPTCWASSRWSHTVCSTPCHGAWTPAPLSANPPSSANTRRLKSRNSVVPAAQHLISLSDSNNIHAAQLADHQWNAEWMDSPTRLCIFMPDTGAHPPGMTLPRRAWIRLNHLRTGVGRFLSCMHKWGMASSGACECGAEEQTVEHVVLQCVFYWPPHGLHGLTVLDDETIQWLLNTCPEIWCGQAVASTTRSKEEKHNCFQFIARKEIKPFILLYRRCFILL